jgi:hypothetical protein
MLIENSILYRKKRSPEAPLTIDHVWLLGLWSEVGKNVRGESTTSYMNNLPCPPSVKTYEDWYDWVIALPDSEATDIRVYMNTCKGFTGKY